MNELLSPKYVICGSGYHVPIVLLIREIQSELPFLTLLPCLVLKYPQLPCGCLRHQRQVFY